mmetsp:Transcript_17079/g.25449  ORF Transcript_17079/g.25449 Transcript_17079/m.25449 type:complete len:136 (-) Transcript_17079:1623-2030(-)
MGLGLDLGLDLGLALGLDLGLDLALKLFELCAGQTSSLASVLSPFSSKNIVGLPHSTTVDNFLAVDFNTPLGEDGLVRKKAKRASGTPVSERASPPLIGPAHVCKRDNGAPISDPVSPFMIGAVHACRREKNVDF